MTEVLTYEALKAERDALAYRVNALAVENQALKARTVTVPTKVYVKDMRCNVVRWAQVVDALSEAGVAFVRDDGELIAGTRETPATDVALAAIRLEAKIEGANELAERIAGMHSKTAPGSYIEKKLMLEAGAAIAYANGLREGK
ncbi:hypothetical protein ACY2EW_08615 [Serratia nevei]